MGDVSNDGTSNVNYAAAIADHRKISGTGLFQFGAHSGNHVANFDQSYDTITEFDPSGSTLTVPAGMDAAGDITGTYRGAGNVWRGFIRTAAGAITSYDEPNAGTGKGQGTFGGAANPAGDVTGWYIDSDGVEHGFERTATGTFTSFDAKHAGQTVAFAISSKGVITGPYMDRANVEHSYVRNRAGRVVDFDPPGATATEAWGVNAAGDITGFYVDAGSAVHAFLRTP